MREHLHRARVAARGAVLLVILAVAPDARGDASAARLEYRAAPGCPDEEAFAGQLRARSSKISLSRDGAVFVRVRIAARGERYQGDLRIVDAAGRESQRHLEGTCADVTAALALITAVALDPSAAAAPEALASAATTTTPPVATPGPASPASPASPPPPKPEPSQPAAPPEAKAPPPPAPPAATDEKGVLQGAGVKDGASHGWAWSIGAGAAVTSGIAPQLLLSIPVFVDVVRRAPGVVAPAFRLRFERAEKGPAPAGGESASFVFTTGSLEACPLTFSLSRLLFWPCARVEAGELEAAGAGVTPVRSSTRPWVTAGGVLRSRVTVYGALFAEIEGTAFAPLVRDRFFLEPDTTVHRAPAFAGGGAAGIGASFW